MGLAREHEGPGLLTANRLRNGGDHGVHLPGPVKRGKRIFPHVPRLAVLKRAASCRHGAPHPIRGTKTDVAPGVAAAAPAGAWPAHGAAAGG